MISKIIIRNFQSHKKTELELHPNVNVIIGSSDVGKTAIIRALRWLVWNRPSGDAFRSTWGGDTKVAVELDKLVRVERSKGKENLYHLDNTKFSAIKTDVPEEIAQVLNLNDINLQQQFDRPFLLDESPGAVAAFFNNIAHLDIIDNAIKNVQSWIREINVDITMNETIVEERTESLKEFERLDELDTELIELEHQVTRRNKLATNVKKIEQVLTHVFIADKAITQYNTLLQHELTVDSLLAMVVAKKSIVQDIGKLKEHIVQIDQTQRNLKIIESEVEKRQHEFDRDFPSVCPLCGKAK
jgi:DNA repair ATPase RecN